MPQPSRTFARVGVGLLASFAGCASYEQMPSATDAANEPACSSACSGSASGGKGAVAGSAGRASSGAASGNGAGGRGPGSSGGSGGSGGGSLEGGHAGVFVAGGASPSAGAGQAGEAASAGTASAGGASGGFPLSWTFAQDTEGWVVRDQSPELAVMLTAAAGAAQLNDVPLSRVKQFVDVAYTFANPMDLRGRTLHATLQRTAGEFVGVQLYVYAGSWQSPGFESLSSGAVTVVTATVDSLSGSGFTPASVARIGLKLGTGSNAANMFAKTSIQITEVTID